MIPRARILDDAFWWGRNLERFYLTYRTLLANEHFDLQSTPLRSSVSQHGWGLLCTGQWNAFHEQSAFLDRFHLWHWWTDVQTPYGLPALYRQLRQGLRSMRSEFRADWFEQWNRYQFAFEAEDHADKHLDHPMLQAVSQLYPQVLGMLEMEHGRTSLTTWVRLGLEWERLDMTVRLLILQANHALEVEVSRLIEWTNYVQDVSLRAATSTQEWLSSRTLMRSLPSIYARLTQCLETDPLLKRLALPVLPARLEQSLLLDYQERLFDACKVLEDLVSVRIEGGI